jgi:hypothetical protein
MGFYVCEATMAQKTAAPEGLQQKEMFLMTNYMVLVMRV